MGNLIGFIECCLSSAEPVNIVHLCGNDQCYGIVCPACRTAQTDCSIKDYTGEA